MRYIFGTSLYSDHATTCNKILLFRHIGCEMEICILISRQHTSNFHSLMTKNFKYLAEHTKILDTKVKFQFISCYCLSSQNENYSVHKPMHSWHAFKSFAVNRLEFFFFSSIQLVAHYLAALHHYSVALILLCPNIIWQSCPFSLYFFTRHFNQLKFYGWLSV